MDASGRDVGAEDSGLFVKQFENDRVGWDIIWGHVEELLIRGIIEGGAEGKQVNG